MKQPEKQLLSQWYQGNLEGEELAKVEEWADQNPDLASSVMEEMMEPLFGLDAIESPAEVPYPEFFNSKLKQQIEIFSKYLRMMFP